MKFTVDINDFWLDEEEEIAPALKAFLIRDIVTNVSKSIEDKVEKAITEKVKEVVDSKMSSIIDNELTDLVATGIIVISGKEIPIPAYIKQVFENSTGWGNADRQIKQYAEKFGKEMKVQYNAAFANQIVSNMKEQGFFER